MKLEFPYLEKDGRYFPIIRVKLKSRKKELLVEALIDSGASFSVFRSEIADYLKITIEKGKPVYLIGIGGRILGYLHSVPVEVDGVGFSCKIVFSKEYTVSLNLLGRDNFFVPFLITFSENSRKLRLVEN